MPDTSASKAVFLAIVGVNGDFLTQRAQPKSDWKVMKCTEAKLLGEDLPYDLEALHEKRKAVRDEINKLQAELNADSAAE